LAAKRGRRKKIPKRQWGDDVSSGQAEPAKISPIQRRSSSQQQQSLSSQGPPPEPRKSPLRLRQATPDASQGKPASSQSLQTHPKVGIGAAAKCLGSGGKPASVAVKMATTPSAKPPGQSSSKPLGAAITTLPVTPLSSPLLSTPTKSDPQGLPLTQQQQASSGGSTGSPSGVNRRTAVLFTRKAAAAAFRKPDTPTPAAPKRRVGRPRKNLDAALGTVASPPSSPLMLPGTSPLVVIGDPQSHLKGPLNSTSAAHLGQADPSSPIVPATESFRVYRSGGDIPAETDDDSQSESSSSSCSSSGSSSESEGGGSSEDEEGPHSESSGEGGADDINAGNSAGGHRHQTGQQLSCGVVPLKPLDLVWAKCRGYPWYPALIIDPKMPKTGILHNGVPIPAAPAEVLALSLNYTEPVFLVLQWLPRNKLEPLGMSAELDESKLTESRKPTERKAVRKAFQEAMQYQCQVSGQSGETPLSSQSPSRAVRFFRMGNQHSQDESTRSDSPKLKAKASLKERLIPIHPLERLAKALSAKCAEEEHRNGISCSIFTKYVFPNYPRLAEILYFHFLHGTPEGSKKCLSVTVFEHEAQKLLTVMSDERQIELYLKMFAGGNEVHREAFHEILSTAFQLAMDHYPEGGPQQCPLSERTLAAVLNSAFHGKQQLSVTFLAHWIIQHCPRLLLSMHRFVVHCLTTAHRTIAEPIK
ncbi:hypothetical protein J437_LFUL013889, partial [Ladona fulva]